MKLKLLFILEWKIVKYKTQNEKIFKLEYFENSQALRKLRLIAI